MCIRDSAYSELNDPIDQRERFAQQDANAAAGDDLSLIHIWMWMQVLRMWMLFTQMYGYLWVSLRKYGQNVSKSFPLIRLQAM